MKRLIFVITLLVMTLTACSGGGAYDQAYMASGDGTNELELSRTNQFRVTDDINVVVKLNTHDSDVEVKATFFDGEGNQVGDPLSVTAGENIGTVVLGLDFESKPDSDPWSGGGWKVRIEVDGEEVETLDFRVG